MATIDAVHSLTVQPAAPSAKLSVATGDALSIATVGMPQRFTINVVDDFDNSWSTRPSDVLWHATLHRARPGDNTGTVKRVSSLSSGQELWEVTVLDQAGVYQLPVLQLSPGGLCATVYHESLGSSHRQAIASSVVASSWSVDGSYAASDAQRLQARWSGFVRPAHPQVYTFRAAVRSIDERVQLWVSNALVIDGWSSLSAPILSGSIAFTTAQNMYQLELQYATGNILNNGISLTWASSSILESAVPTTSLYCGDHIHGSPFAVFAQVGVTCASQSYAISGKIEPFWTAGSSVQFTIQSRDAAASIRPGGGDLFVAWMTPDQSMHRCT